MNPEVEKGEGGGAAVDDGLLQKVLETLEFYFSDINLSRNKFLAHKVLENPYVPISLLLTFHKLQQLTQDSAVVAEAVRRSTVLHLSEDSAKVFRTTEIQTIEQLDEHHIYVENVPDNKNQEWLHAIFSSFGNVIYVSLPVYKHSRCNKGFAFVEFSSEQEVQDCYEVFDGLGLTLDAHGPPELMLSIKTHEDDKPLKGDKPLVDRKELVNSIVETKDLTTLGMKIMLKKDWKRQRNRFLNRVHHENKKIEKKEGEDEEEEEYKKDLVLKLEKSKHEGNLDEFLMGIRLRPNGGVVFVTNKPKDDFVLIRFNTAESATAFMTPDLPYVSRVEGEEEAKYWAQVAKIVAAKKQRRLEQKFERRREKRRERRAATYDEPESIGFEALLERRQLDKEAEIPQVSVDPELRSKRKKKRDRRPGAKVANQHIFFKDEEEEEEEVEAKTAELEPCDVNLKREGGLLEEAPECKKHTIAAEL